MSVAYLINCKQQSQATQSVFAHWHHMVTYCKLLPTMPIHWHEVAAGCVLWPIIERSAWVQIAVIIIEEREGLQ